MMDKPTSEPILYVFLTALVNDQWVEPRIKLLAQDALGQYEEQVAGQAPATEASKPQAQPRASSGRAGGGGR